MSDVDIGKLKVVELKAELQARGLDTKGNKAVLVKRLQDAIDSGAALKSVDEGDESQSSATNLGGSGDDSCNQDDDSSKQEGDNSAPQVQVKQEPVDKDTAADASSTVQVNGEQQVKEEMGAGDASKW
ncbi:hypothetical protein MRX96_041042 [Rhipicephalus microplus]